MGSISWIKPFGPTLRLVREAGSWMADQWDAHARILAPPSDRPIRRALYRAVKNNALPLGTKVFVPSRYRVSLWGERYEAFRPIQAALENSLTAGLSQHLFLNGYAFDSPALVKITFTSTQEAGSRRAPEVTVLRDGYPEPDEGELL